LTAFCLFAVFTCVRMLWLSDSGVYKTNVLMGANPVFLAFVLLIFTAFNVVFIGGFFKTAYNFGKPFIAFLVMSFLLIGLGETLHHLPGLGWLNELGLDHAGRQLPVLLAAAVAYAAATTVSCRTAQNRFEKIDL